MNKKFLAIAVAAAMAPVAATADVKVYGIAQIEYNIEDRSNGNSLQGVDDEAGRSRIGFKFSEKLGGGMTAFGKIEFRLDPADNAGNGTNQPAPYGSLNNAALGQRDAHVGIKSSWGSIAAGSFNAPYKVAGGVKWDPWAATHLQARRAGGMSGGAGVGGHNGFMRNAVMYTSPNVNGFKAQFALSPDETNAGAANGANADNDYSLSVQYKNGPWQAIFAHNRNNTAANDETLTKIGLRWKSGPWSVAGQYEDVNDAVLSVGGGAPGGTNYGPTAGSDATFLWLNGNYKAGNNIFSLSWGQTDVDQAGAAADYDVDYWALGVTHKFSKKTRIFAGYTETDTERAATPDRDAWTVGIRKDF